MDDPTWRPASRTVFARWLAEMDSALTGFIGWGLPVRFSAEHYTREALRQLEGVVAERFPRGSADVLGPHADRIWIDGAARYVGETLRRAHGGRWHYDTSPTAVDRGRPVLVVDAGSGPTVLSVFGLLVTTAAEPWGAVLTTVWDHLEPAGPPR